MSSNTSYWNPLTDIREDWSSSQSIWGKLATLLFYSYIWLGIFTTAVQVFLPLTAGYECLVEEGATDSQKAVITSYLSQYSLFVCFVLLFLANRKATLSNITNLVTIVLVAFIVSYNRRTGIDQECYSGLVNQWIYAIIWALLAWIFAYGESRRHVSGGGETTGAGGENEPLLEGEAALN